MFEKYSDEAINARGGGGEYAVVEGFGWTNGVLIWAAVSTVSTLVRGMKANEQAGRLRSTTHNARLWEHHSRSHRERETKCSGTSSQGC